MPEEITPPPVEEPIPEPEPLITSKAEIFDALMTLYPEGAPDEHRNTRLPDPENYTEFKAWWKGPPVTEQELADARDAWQATKQTKVDRQAKRDKMKADFMSMDPELRGAYWETFNAVNNMLDAGDDAAAKKAIRMVDVKPKLSQKNKDVFEAVRQQFETKLDEL